MVDEDTGWERGLRVKGCLATMGEEGRVAVTKSGSGETQIEAEHLRKAYQRRRPREQALHMAWMAWGCHYHRQRPGARWRERQSSRWWCSMLSHCWLLESEKGKKKV